MPVQIKIDQAGKSAGVAGQAREDLATGVSVTLTAIGGPFLAYRWRIVSKPVNILISTRSSATLATPTASVTLCTPINLKGMHLVELAVDSGNGIGASDADIVRITFYAGPALSGAPQDLPRRHPAPYESLEHNVPDGLDAAGNPDGWAREWERWFAVIEALVPGKSWGRGRFTNPSGVPTLIDSDGGVTVTHVSTGITRCTFVTPMPALTYSVLPGVIIVAGSPHLYATVQAQNLTVDYFDLLTYDLVAAAPANGFDVGFRVEYASP